MNCYKVANRYETEIVYITSRKKAVAEVKRMLGGEPDGAYSIIEDGTVEYANDKQVKRMLQGYFDDCVFAIGTRGGYYNKSVSVTAIKVK